MVVTQDKQLLATQKVKRRYTRIPNNEILEILKLSFDALGEEEKNVFLDIACCLKGCKMTEVLTLYDDCIKYHIGVLVKKSLIKVRHDKIYLHDLIQDIGREIERQESPQEPGKGRRLWLQKI